MQPARVQKVKVVKSHLAAKKYDAIFSAPDFRKVVPFGASGYEDYTTHKDPIRRERYLKRHSGENWDNPMTAGSLSRYLLWGESTSFNENLREFKRRFKLA